MQQVAQGTSPSLSTPPAALLCLPGCVSHPGKVMKAIKNLMTTACCPSPERGLGPCIYYLKNPVDLHYTVSDACRRAASNSSLWSLGSSPCSQHVRGRMLGVLLDSTGQPAESLSHPARKGKYSPQHLSMGSFPHQGGGGSLPGCLPEATVTSPL